MHHQLRHLCHTPRNSAMLYVPLVVRDIISQLGDIRVQSRRAINVRSVHRGDEEETHTLWPMKICCSPYYTLLIWLIMLRWLICDAETCSNDRERVNVMIVEVNMEIPHSGVKSGGCFHLPYKIERVHFNHNIIFIKNSLPVRRPAGWL